MDRVVVIANPTASQFTGGTHRDVMSILARAHEVDAFWPASTAETTRTAYEAASGGAAVVVAMGGDGMVHHVSQGLIGTDTALAIIPVGTTNVMGRLLGIPSRPTRAARLIDRTAGPRSIGVVRLTLDRGSMSTSHHALFAVGFGLDAEVVAEADQDPYKKYRFGSIHYARTALRIAMGRFPSRRPNMRVTAGDRTTHSSATFIQFRDVYTYFGRSPLRIGSSTPEPMTVMSIDRLRRRRVPRIVLAALGGRGLGEVRGLEVWSGVSNLEISADPPVAAQADGESLGLTDGARIDWISDALGVIPGS